MEMVDNSVLSAEIVQGMVALLQQEVQVVAREHRRVVVEQAFHPVVVEAVPAIIM